MANIAFKLRPAVPSDGAFLFSVYASTRTEEMSLVDWSQEQKDAFLLSQFIAQDRYYRENYPGAEFSVILLGEKPAGRLYIHRRKDEIRIMDITLLPDFRGLGIGTALLRQVIEEGSTKNLPVTIHVERFNPALHLYERLGFRLAEDKGVYYFMKWSPERKE